jgi:hypothetical protein
MKAKLILFIFTLAGTLPLWAQISINTDGSQPDPSAMLDVQSTTQGVLLPRMTMAQRVLIESPADGLMVFCTDCGSNGSISVFSNGVWSSFTPCITPSSSAVANGVSPGKIIWNWNAIAGVSGYKWNTTNTYATATDMGSATSKTETGILCDSTYTRYVWAYNSCSVSLPASLVQSVTNVPISPSAGTHIQSQTSIVWNWNSVPNVSGYKWSITNNFETATDMGLVLTKNESGISCGTAYTRFVWAYNGCGYSTPVTLVQSTTACWICGISALTVNHVVTGGVAPVNKNTTYGTVTNIPGETSKCWITSNLGSNNQATAVNDATETSAGWYWQFNRKQGYKHDGTTRTPNTTWITSFSENFNWQTLNDPCTIELGVGWRIPTNTELNNILISGGWTNWGSVWNSGLKLHASGRLDASYMGGFLFDRGSWGYFWSGSQFSTSNGRGLRFSSYSCDTYNDPKSFGLTIRCIKE